uniref:BACK domain-containing protein n=1 Tax=Tetradesmus obliquus TaxID=3088 RepID=A0A383VDV4_TETOB
MELDLCDLLDREEMTWLEMQQAGFNVDPLVTGYCGDEVAVWVHVEDSAGTRKEHVIASPSYLRKSGWFKAALGFKEQQPEQITMHVSQPEDVELGVLLVSWLHDGVMPSHVRQCQHSLLVLLDLAGYYQLPCLVDSLLTWLLVQLHGQPAWSTLLCMCRASPEPWLCASQLFAPAASLARAKLLAALAPYDLELLQQSAHGASMLLTLPYDILLQLLHSHETRVAAESSVAALITTWLAAQPEPATPEQQLELAHCLRLRGMPAYYLQQVLPQLRWWSETMGTAACKAQYWLQVCKEAEQQQISPCCSSPGSSTGSDCSDSSRYSNRSANSDTSSVVRRALERKLKAAKATPEETHTWLLLLRDPRAPSAVSQLQLAAGLDQQQLAQAYADRPAVGDARWQGAGYHAFAGLEWQLCWRLAPGRVRGKLGLQLHVGVVFSLATEQGLTGTLVRLPTPVLHHSRAVVPGGSVVTRAQAAAEGCDPWRQLAVLKQGGVLACREVLPLRLSCEGRGWGEAEQRCLARFLDDDSGRLELRVGGICDVQ